MASRVRIALLAVVMVTTVTAGAAALRQSAGLEPAVGGDAGVAMEGAEAASSPEPAAAATGEASTTTALPAPPPPPVPTRSVHSPAWSPFATVEGITLVHPAERVERVAFHQSNHEGAREMVPAPTAAEVTVLESRERLTALTSAVDIVVDPAVAIRAPVSGRVIRGGSYVLYCKTTDDYVVIEPDGRPGWEVKILHMQHEQVSVGQRVEAGVTQIAAHATVLPFESQVDRLRSVDPAWPHVHIEVVDPSIPNVPSPGSGSSC